MPNAKASLYVHAEVSDLMPAGAPLCQEDGRWISEKSGQEFQNHTGFIDPQFHFCGGTLIGLLLLTHTGKV